MMTVRITLNSACTPFTSPAVDQSKFRPFIIRIDTAVTITSNGRIANETPITTAKPTANFRVLGLVIHTNPSPARPASKYCAVDWIAIRTVSTMPATIIAIKHRPTGIGPPVSLRKSPDAKR
ncbi:hypothetical protein C5C31_13815 [Rathayibacter rathayi]|uniref:Uncharacterized protein n=1 Tax=Rathayibacter rathayi TaxID=33887 RepID=A0ABX5A9P8_RATRA|nr:hypothetical protein C5C34_10285 [Rathayibacter rathayi]PPF42640.1 hypothetical protein C5C08_14765 [Rathayibacter rathayi]PPF75289.1 hypothetical protein C5C14_14530 [Rathayibacter rathayi]PPG09852.1 hypothetical protein C5C11_14890 [Rathayibacter rathayi]PPG36434.1 hypothetical protein C5C20_15310 [Rathayibacter rathayi]